MEEGGGDEKCIDVGFGGHHLASTVIFASCHLRVATGKRQFSDFYSLPLLFSTAQLSASISSRRLTGSFASNKLAQKLRSVQVGGTLFTVYLWRQSPRIRSHWSKSESAAHKTQLQLSIAMGIAHNQGSSLESGCNRLANLVQLTQAQSLLAKFAGFPNGTRNRWLAAVGAIQLTKLDLSLQFSTTLGSRLALLTLAKRWEKSPRLPLGGSSGVGERLLTWPTNSCEWTIEIAVTCFQWLRFTCVSQCRYIGRVVGCSCCCCCFSLCRYCEQLEWVLCRWKAWQRARKLAYIALKQVE